MSEHAPRGLGGSTARRTIECPAWIRVSEGIPDSPSSEYADRGTLLHNAMAAIMTGHVDNEPDVIGMAYNGIMLTEDLYKEKIEPALVAFDAAGYDVTNVEQKVRFLVPGVGEAWGTADIIGGAWEGGAWEGDAFKRYLVLDWKFGDGIRVSAAYPEGPNDQLMFYAAGWLNGFDATLPDEEEIELAIIQPFDAEDPMDMVSRTVVTVGQVKLWQQDFADALKATDEEPNEGDWCKFCPGEIHCPAKTKAVMALPPQEELTTIAPNPVTMEALQDYLDKAEMAEQWANAVRAYAHDQLSLGQQIEGWKLVEKRANRKWTDETAVRKFLRNCRLKVDQITETKLRSPAQIEKLVKQKGQAVNSRLTRLGELCEAKSSGTTLARASDKRPAVKPLSHSGIVATLAASLPNATEVKQETENERETGSN